MLRSIGSIAVLLGASVVLRAQEQQGLVHGNYAGTDAVGLNPARIAGQWCWMDVNIIGADASVWNDHVYLTGRERSVLGEMRETLRTGADRLVVNEDPRSGGRHAYVHARLKGPALAWSSGRNGFGAHVSTRAAVSIGGVGEPLARFAYHGFTYRPQHGIRYSDDRLRIAGAAWTEVGGSYARQLVARDFHRFSAGLTARYLIAHAGAGIAFNDLDYTVLDTLRAEVHQATGRYGTAMPALDAGRGHAFDLGISYERTLDEADGYVPHTGCDALPYRYRLGFSVVDIGGLRFRDGYTARFDASTADFQDYNALEVDDVSALDSLVSASLSTSRAGTGFRTGLPTAAALQFDHRITHHVYMAASVVQNLAFGDGLRIRRANTAALIPRFEHQRVEFALPIVVHEYDLRRTAVGAMLRLNNVSFGSDDLLPLITRGNLYGLDLYFRIKWTVFRSPVCRGRRQAQHRPGDGHALPCAVPQ